MLQTHLISGVLVGVFFLANLAVAVRAVAQKKIACPDGEHIEIDIKQIAIQYDGSSFAGTLSSLSVLGARFEVAPKKLQEAAAAAQQWDVFLRGLVAGYNSCSITRQQYADGLGRIYPRVKEDAAGLEEIRKSISEGKRADEKRLQNLLNKYYESLREFAHVSGQEIILERIDALSEQVSRGNTQILQKEDTNADRIIARLDQIDQKNAQSRPPTPGEVSGELSELRERLRAKADEAEAEYKKGYDLYDRYRFVEAIPHLEQAAAAVQLPDFYLALGEAYRELPNLPRAEAAVRKGLALVAEHVDLKREASLDNLLGVVLLNKADLESALDCMQAALRIDGRLYGLDDPMVARDANNIGQVLKVKGDLDGALRYTQQALRVYEKVYGLYHRDVGTVSSNMGQILYAKGDLVGALSYLERALKIGEIVHGIEHPSVAIRADQIGYVLQAKGDLDGALRYTQRALEIDEIVYGPDHPNVAIRADHIGQILLTKGDLDGALRYSKQALDIVLRAYGADDPNVATYFSDYGQILFQRGDMDDALSYASRALEIDQKVPGSDHPAVARDDNNIGQILYAKGDLEGALSYTQRALKIDEKVYGADNSNVAIYANNIGQILQAEGDLNGALSYTQRALDINEKTYGPDNPKVAIRADNIGQILLAKGDLDSALSYAQRAVKIFEKAYGPDNPATKVAITHLEAIKHARQK